MQSIKSVAVGLYLGIAAIVLAVIGVASPAHAVPITTPAGLSPGDQYRLAFVTSTSRDATSIFISVYNTFVTTAANSQPDLLALGVKWRAIASVFAGAPHDARDNTGTRFPGLNDAPIYLLDGITKIADGNLDLWDGTIDAPLNIFEDGTLAPSRLSVWSGTLPDGTSQPLGFNLGDATPVLGRTDVFSDFWIQLGTAPKTGEFSLYALSDVITVVTVPSPGALILFGSGLACLAALRRRNRSVRPA